MISLVVCGATGRMGTLICQLAEHSKDWKVVRKVSKQSPLETSIQHGEVIIDFSLPEATNHHLQLALQHKKPIVIGATGLSSD